MQKAPLPFGCCRSSRSAPDPVMSSPKGEDANRSVALEVYERWRSGGDKEHAQDGDSDTGLPASRSNKGRPRCQEKHHPNHPGESHQEEVCEAGRSVVEHGGDWLPNANVKRTGRSAEGRRGERIAGALRGRHAMRSTLAQVRLNVLFK